MSNEKEKQEFRLNELKSTEIAEHPYVRGRFIDTLVGIHQMRESDAASAYEREAMYYKKALTGSEKIRACTNISLFSTFLEVAINNLSLQPGAKSDAFIESRNVNLGTREAPKWESIASLSISAYGELKMRIRAGQILRMNNPVVLYDGDHFQPHTNERGEMTIDYRPAIPRKSNTIIGCYVSMILPGNYIDFKWMLPDDIERLRKYSIPAGKRRDESERGNALYSSNNGQIDPGFLEAKTIKHAMRTCLKLRTGDSVSFEGDDEMPEPMDVATPFAPEAPQGETPGAEPAVTMEDNEEIF